MNTTIKMSAIRRFRGLLIGVGIASFFVPVTVFGSTDTHIKMHAPKLSPEYPTMLTWKWHHENPYRWNVYSLLYGGTTEVLVDDYWAWGSARQFGPDGGSAPMFIVGVDQFGTEITGRSNIVRPDDAPDPKVKSHQ